MAGLFLSLNRFSFGTIKPSPGTEQYSSFGAERENKMNNPQLVDAWRRRCQLCTMSYELDTEALSLGKKLHDALQNDTALNAGMCKLDAERFLMQLECRRLRFLGDYLWASAVLEVYGNIGMDWGDEEDEDGEDKEPSCTLANGEVYDFVKAP